MFPPLPEQETARLLFVTDTEATPLLASDTVKVVVLPVTGVPMTGPMLSVLLTVTVTNSVCVSSISFVPLAPSATETIIVSAPVEDTKPAVVTAPVASSIV